jgi:hypothetical protein
MYAEGFGWFSSAAATPHVMSFLDELGAAATSGDWRLVEPATATLMVRAARTERGPSYHEAFHFLRTLRAVLMQPLLAQDPSVRIALVQLFETVERGAAQEAGLFFDPASRIGDTGPNGQPAPAIAARARRSAGQACEALAAMSACDAALVLAGGPDERELEIVGAAGVPVAAAARVALGGDPFSLALTAGTPTVVHSTSAVRQLPAASGPARTLPLVASAQSGALRVATVLLIRVGREVDSRVLAPLADLNGRLTAVLDGSARDAEVRVELSRVGEYLGSVPAPA